jgi:hypothetical protein
MRDDSWDDKEEAFLTKLESQCNIYSAYYNKDYLYYHKLSSKFNIPILIISALNALCAIALNDFLEQKFVSILNAVLSAGTGVLGSVQLYMKITEKMTNATRTQMLMKRLALKISKELSINRETRATDGQAFLQECFGEFNAALEQGNPMEKKLQNFLALDKNAVEETNDSIFKMAANLMSPLSPRKTATPSPEDSPPKEKPKPRQLALLSKREEVPIDDSPRSTQYGEP